VVKLTNVVLCDKQELYSVIESNPEVSKKVLAKRTLLTLTTAIILHSLTDHFKDVVGV
jgi:hypothetical protein